MPLSLSFSEGSRYDRGTDLNELLQGCGGVEKSTQMVYLSMSGPQVITGSRLESIERDTTVLHVHIISNPQIPLRV